VTGRGFSPVSPTNKTDRHDITEILFKVALKYHQTNKQTVIVYVLNSGIENDTLDQAK
jgi:hypothetical protein